jgi:hypothetical protein
MKRKNALLAMQRSIYYPDSCSEALLNHVCDPCDDGEGSGVRGVFYYKDGAFGGTPTQAMFEQGAEDGTIIVIPKTRGTYDGGTPTYGKGFGDQEQTYEGSTYKLTYTDPNYKLNNDFYDNAQSATLWNVGWRSETLIHLSEKVVTIYGKDPHSDDNKNKVYWEVDVTWSSKDKPRIYDMPAGIFQCFQVIEA